MTDFEIVCSQSKLSGKPILLSFSGSDWCGWCVKLDREVFSQPEFRQWAAQSVIFFSVDFPRTKEQSPELKKLNAELAQKYNVDSFPTVVLIDAAGQEIARTGYRPGGAESYVEYLTELLG